MIQDEDVVNIDGKADIDEIFDPVCSGASLKIQHVDDQCARLSDVEWQHR